MFQIKTYVNLNEVEMFLVQMKQEKGKYIILLE